MTALEVVAALATLAAGLGFGAIAVKWLDRDVTAATARKTDIDNLRSIIDEVSANATRHATRADALEARVGVLEERERHMLTRAAVHEAWDQFAFAALVANNPQHPPPPPLTDPRSDTHE